MRLILVRHGESKHRHGGMITGRSYCPGLTEKGFEQAGVVAGRFGESGEFRDCSALLVSPVLRARQTAEPLAEVLGLEPIIDDDLTEVRPGVAEGMSWEMYRQQYGWFDMVAEPERPFAPGGESWLDYKGRVRVTMRRLAEEYDGRTVVAVSHAGFIVVSLLVLFEIPASGRVAYLDPAYTSLTEWRFGEGRWQLERYNDVTHL